MVKEESKMKGRSLIVIGAIYMALSATSGRAAGVQQIIGPDGDGLGNVLSAPSSVAVDDAGNVYVAGGSHVFKIGWDLSITMIFDQSGDGFNECIGPWDVAVDTAGNVYVACKGTNLDEHNAFKITPAGVKSLIIDYSGDGTHFLEQPSAIAVDEAGNVYVAGEEFVNNGVNSHNVFKITPAGTITQIIDTTGDGAGHPLVEIRSIAVDGNGNVYVAGSSTDNAFRISPAGAIAQIIDSLGDGVNSLDAPRGIAVGADGSVYVSGYGGWNLFMVSPGGQISEIMDSTAVWSQTGKAFYDPVGVAVDELANVYVTCLGSDNAFRLTPEGVITEIIDSDGDGRGNLFDHPDGRSVAVYRSGTVFVSGSASNNAFRIPVGAAGVPALSSWGAAMGGMLVLIVATLGLRRRGARRAQGETSLSI
jgi:hypothetical protein